MTSLGADTFGLEGRGRLVEDSYADLIVFDEHTINDHAEFGDPIHHCSGIEHVLINGKSVVKSGVPLDFDTPDLQVPGQRL